MPNKRVQNFKISWAPLKKWIIIKIKRFFTIKIKSR